MKEQPSPETQARLYVALLRLWAHRLCQSFTEVPLKNHSVTVLEIDTPEAQTVAITIRRLAP